MLHPGVYALAAQAADEAGARLVVLECVLVDAAEHRRRIEERSFSNRRRGWAINDWPAFLDYRARTLPYTDFAINALRHVVDLSQTEQHVTRDAVGWLRSLVEPRKDWMPRQRWDALVRGEDCPLCAELTSSDTENAHGLFVADLGISRLLLAREQHMRGWCVLVCRLHVREAHELSEPERNQFFDDMLRVGEILEHVYDALKMNYQILGNAVPHLHAHIQPRFYGDPYPGQPVGGPPSQPVVLSAGDYRRQIETIRAALDMGLNRGG